MPYFEYPLAFPDSPLISELLDPPLVPDADGMIEVPTRPGFRVERERRGSLSGSALLTPVIGAELLQPLLYAGDVKAREKQRGIEQSKGDDVHKERRQHDGRQAPSGLGDDPWVHTSPPADGHKVEWHGDKGDDAVYTGQPCATGWLIYGVPQCEIGGVEQPQDGACGEAWIPGPPRAPYRSGP
jgi:hypothetical protein